MKNLKNTNKGITLIALVITIIVLLILAGVALATLTGDSGILSNAENAKEQTMQANVKEKVQLAIMEHKIGQYSEGKTLKEYLEEAGATEVNESGSKGVMDEFTFEIKDGEVTVIKGTAEEKKINVKYSVSEGKDLWNSIVTLNVSIEKEFTIEQKGNIVANAINFNSYDELKIATSGSVEEFEKKLISEGLDEDEFLDVAFEDLEITSDFATLHAITLEQKREIVAYMFDYENYENFKKRLSDSRNTTYEEVLEQTGYTEIQFLNYLIECGKYMLNYDDIDKLESLGLEVISVKTPYNTTFYTTSLDGEVACGFVKNGTYTFEIGSGETSTKQIVTINNIRDYSIEKPYEVKIDYDMQSEQFTKDPVISIDDTGEWISCSSTILSANDSISIKLPEGLDQGVDDDGNYILNGDYIDCVIKDEQYYKYFTDGVEWRNWRPDNSIYVYMYVINEQGNILTSRQILADLALANLSIYDETEIGEQWSASFGTRMGAWCDYIDEYVIPYNVGTRLERYNDDEEIATILEEKPYLVEIYEKYKTIDQNEILKKYPQLNIGKRGIMGPITAFTLDLEKDSNVLIVLENNID